MYLPICTVKFRICTVKFRLLPRFYFNFIFQNHGLDTQNFSSFVIISAGSHFQCLHTYTKIIGFTRNRQISPLQINMQSYYTGILTCSAILFIYAPFTSIFFKSKYRFIVETLRYICNWEDFTYIQVGRYVNVLHLSMYVVLYKRQIID